MSRHAARPTTGWTATGQHLRPLDLGPGLDDERRIDDVIVDDWIYPSRRSPVEVTTPRDADRRCLANAILC